MHRKKASRESWLSGLASSFQLESIFKKKDVERKGWELLRNTVGCCKIIADDGQHLLGPTDKVTVAHARGNNYG